MVEEACVRHVRRSGLGGTAAKPTTEGSPLVASRSCLASALPAGIVQKRGLRPSEMNSSEAGTTRNEFSQSYAGA
jgi:hypothetical protein